MDAIFTRFVGVVVSVALVVTQLVYVPQATASPMRYEQDDARIAYTGAWSTGTSLTRSGGSWAYTTARGATAHITFEGTSVVLLSTMAPSMGIAKVTIDGQEPTLVDLYSASFSHQKEVFSATGLSPGPHTLVIECTGTKHSSSSGTAIGIDALEVEGTLAQASAPVRFEQDDTNLFYTGTWTTAHTSTRSGGSWATASRAGATAHVAFSGTSLALVTSTAPSMGIAKVTIDGGTPVLVDLYSPGFSHRSRVFSRYGLADGPHTATVEYTGLRNDLSTGTAIGIDAIEVQGSLAPAATRYEQDDGRAAYAGTWTTAAAANRSGGSWTWTASPGAAAHLAFEGDAVALLSTKAPSMGIARVTLDGEAPALVDMYAASFSHQVPVFSRSGLSSGPHTLVVEYTGTRNAASSGTAVGIDALAVTGALTQAYVPTRFEQDDALLLYAGSWATAPAATRSGGSWTWTAAAGAAAHVAFEGTSFALITSTAPSMGIAKVTIDGQAPVLVDLYSAGFTHQRKVFSRQGLASGLHTAVIEYTGLKDALSSGTAIGIDAIEIAGVLVQATAP